MLFAKALKSADVNDLLTQVATAGPAAGPGAGPAAAAEVVEEKKEEAVEEVDMGGLFGDDDDGY